MKIKGTQIVVDNINKDSFHRCEEPGNHLISLKGTCKGRSIKKVRQELGHILTTLFDNGLDNIIVNSFKPEPTAIEVFYIYTINEKIANKMIDDLLIAVTEYL